MDGRGECLDLRSLASGDIAVPEPVVVHEGFLPTGGHIGQFRQHRQLGNMTGNKGRRSLSVVGKPCLLAIVERQQVISQ